LIALEHNTEQLMTILREMANMWNSIGFPKSPHILKLVQKLFPFRFCWFFFFFQIN
jgi:hypothetical protein